jgi:hypothetical protein
MSKPDTIPAPPPSIAPEHCCGSCAAVLLELQHLRERYGEVLAAIANPPWLPQLVEAVTTMSAAKEVSEEVADSKRRIDRLESRVDELEKTVRSLVGDGK